MTGEFRRASYQPPPSHYHHNNPRWPGHYLREGVPPEPVRIKTDLELIDDAICAAHQQYRK